MPAKAAPWARDVAVAGHYSGVTAKTYDFAGAEHRFTEVHLLGPTSTIRVEARACRA